MLHNSEVIGAIYVRDNVAIVTKSEFLGALFQIKYYKNQY